jgi:Kef-type K+ transport system membrane component KefB
MSVVKKRLGVDIIRIVLFSLISLLALIPMWQASQVIFYFIGAIALLAIATHLFRRLLFPYIDLREHADSALHEKNIASALIVLAVTLIMATIMYSATSLIGFGAHGG